jgi:hypothetical protein
MADDVLKLVGRKVTFQVSDPWEFGTAVGTHPIVAIVEQAFCSQTARNQQVVRHERLLLRVDKPFAFNNHNCEFFLAAPRHLGATFGAMLGSSASVSAALTRIPGVEASATDLFAVESFDAAHFGLIGSIRAEP